MGLRVLYVSYDGALDPLGASQVVPYLVGLADRGFAITLISFEKHERWQQASLRTATRRRLEERGISWRPLRYHRRPRFAASLWNVLAGRRVIASESRRRGVTLVHCRGDIAMAMARWARLPRTTRLLYDVRGFFSDERVETGSWRRGGIIDRVVQHIETENLRCADGAVALTKPAAARLVARRSSPVFHRVIPTCVDLSVFMPRTPGEDPKFGLVYSGSLGTWYMVREMVAFARSAAKFVPGPTLFLTPDTDEAHQAGITSDWAELRTVQPDSVGGWLRLARASFFFIRPIPSKRASSPTKLAEALACGLPIVCNRGIGTLEEIIEKERVGVFVDSFSESAYVEAAQRLQNLLRDRELPERCRRLAEVRYSLKAGVEAYEQLYRGLTEPPGDSVRRP